MKSVYVIFGFMALLVMVIVVVSVQKQNIIITGGGGGGGAHQPFFPGAVAQENAPGVGSSSPRDNIPPNAQFPGGTSGGINWLGLLAAVQAGASTNDKYLQQLSEAYIDYSQGKYDSVNGLAIKPTPSLLYSMHMRETTNNMFLRDDVKAGKIRLVDVNRTTVAAAGKLTGSSTDGIYKDNGGDGEPDGPYQVEKSADKDPGLRSKSSTLAKFDTYSLIDHMNMVADGLQSGPVAGLPSTFSQELKEAFASSVHNRGPGGWAVQNWGVFYMDGSTVNGPKFLAGGGETSSDVSFDSTKLQYEIFTKESARTSADLSIEARPLAIAFLLANGWFLSDTPDNNVCVGWMGELFADSKSRSVIDILFPSHGQTTSDGFKTWVKSNYMKHFSTVMGITDEQAIRANNMGAQPTNSYHYVFTVTDKMIGKEKLKFLTDGEKQKQAHVVDVVSAEYTLTSARKDAYFLNWLLSNGMLDTYAGGKGEDARKLFDPLNPVHILQSRGAGYNPGGTGPSLSDIEAIMGLTAVDPSAQTAATMRQLEVIMDVRGGIYDQDFRTKTGTQTIFNSKGRGNLTWEPSIMEGQEVTDCSSLTQWGYSFGTKRVVTTVSIKDHIGASSMTIDLNGVSVPNYLVQVYLDGSTSCIKATGQAQSVAKWGTSGFAQPGDILVTVPQGHVETVLAVNKTGATVEIPASMHYRGNAINLAPQAVLTMGTGSDKKTSGLSNFSVSAGSDAMMLLRPAFSAYANPCN